MGTTADKLNAVLASKNAIKTKFGLADDLPFSQYADNIEAGGDGDLSFITATADDILAGKVGADAEGNPITGVLKTDDDIYFCKYVNRTYETYQFTVSGLPEDIFANVTDWNGNAVADEYKARNPNGTYSLVKKVEGDITQWRWRNEENAAFHYSHTHMGWCFAPFDDIEVTDNGIMIPPVYAETGWESPGEPWDSSLEWTDATNPPTSTTITFELTKVVPEPVEQYWLGSRLERLDYYWKLFFNDTYDDAVKFPYGGEFMPVAGRFYNSACTMEISHPNIFPLGYYSCPVSTEILDSLFENGLAEYFIVSADSEFMSGNDQRFVEKAFDNKVGYDQENNDYNCWSSNTPGEGGWIQWQVNRPMKVLVRRIELTNVDTDGFFRNATLLGSNDGENWTQLGFVKDYPNYTEDGKTGIYLFPDNITPYVYHRFVQGKDGTRASASRLVAYSLLEPDREVPK